MLKATYGSLLIESLINCKFSWLATACADCSFLTHLSYSLIRRDCGARTVARLFPLLKVELIRLHYPIIIYIAIEYLLAEFFRYYVTITRESLTVD